MTDVLRDQIAYYRARAGEYDEWFYRTGRYDHGAAANGHWFAEVAEVVQALHALGPVGDALELAAGTGIWTRELAQIADHVTSIDAAPEVLAINQQKLADPRVTYQQADLFAWEPHRQYDLVFCAFWLSHVPPERLDAFLATAGRAVRPGGQIVIVDSRHAATSGARNHPLPDAEGTHHTRTLNDGRTFTIIKVFYDPARVVATLAHQGITAKAHTTTEYFYSITGTKGTEHEGDENHERSRKV